MPTLGFRARPAILPKRLDSLTSLRFFAAFAVFAHHFTGVGGGTGFGRSPLIYPYSEIGGHGVTFFFVLSGFLMMWVFKPHEHPGAFYWRRIGRIWPAHLVALVLGVYAYYIAAHKTIHWPSVLSSVFLVQNWFPQVTPTLPGNEVTWTLSVEVLFYALFPLLGRVAARMRTRWLVAATAAGLIGMWAVHWFATAHFSRPHAGWVMRHPLVYLPEFLLGMTLALAVSRGWRLPLRPVVPVTLLLGYVFCYYQGRMRLSDPVVAQLDFTVRPVIAILSGLIIVAFVQREVRGLRGLLNARPLVLLGLWSYSFYLIHHSISRLATYQWGRMPDNDAVLFTMLGMAVVVNAMSWALFAYVEEPAEKWWREHTPRRWLDRQGPGPARAVIPARRDGTDLSPEPEPAPV
ncbi:peptidoglycan/LPS O-acetylase OafA/YrhL [Krasilnikovia cinnamomea]|uniref:Peptidoglycan/LPS O-acetylase OafA/YrhL n=1 Tax=Krasilnikovia cinnamomea TaxID=349313 RepID=A0A4Q7ZGV4_9ACTN|nr:acyltransferase [Krasilnikovia cinnamomea]RZU50032.1 peptidoglycan/LPS O-acetylase OafA/YrhL [Krasilnikovia cinnamomea]